MTRKSSAKPSHVTVEHAAGVLAIRTLRHRVGRHAVIALWAAQTAINAWGELTLKDERDGLCKREEVHELVLHA